MPTSVLWLNSTLAKMPNDFDRSRPGREDFLVVEIGPRARRSAPAAEPGRHQRREPGFVLRGEHESRRGADQQAERGDQDVPARGTHRGRQLPPEECPQPFDRIDARPVDGQERPQRKALQVKQQVAVERDGTRDRQRRERGAIEDRQSLQLVERQRAHATSLDPADEAFELAPARLASLAEFAALEDELRLAARYCVRTTGGSAAAASIVISGPRCLIRR